MSRLNWEGLLDPNPFSAVTLEETLVGGQAFRWFWDPAEHCWIGTWSRHAAALKISGNGSLLAAPMAERTSLADIRQYLGTDRTESLIAQLPCNADPVLAGLCERWRGISLLRQPKGEALLGFICSSNKQILQIRTMLQNLSDRFGQRIRGTPFKTLPTWSKLAKVPEAELRTCALGYRAAHVANAAQFLKAHPGFLDSIEAMPLDEARRTLQQLPGVGPKVADCVLLFGYHQAGAFPVDTWIEQILIDRYPALAGWKRPQLATFAQLHFGVAGGLAQQWFFAEARSPREKPGKEWSPNPAFIRTPVQD